MNKGFITIGSGSYYFFLAENLIKSYRINTKNKYPFCLVTDDMCPKELAGLFDDVVYLKKNNTGFAMKLDLNLYTPYDETIFVDADSFFIKDVSQWWDNFHQNGEFGVFGRNAPIPDVFDEGRLLITEKAAKKYKLKNYIAFNGGVYYFTKTEFCNRIFRRAKDLFENHYTEEDFLLFGEDKKKGDEPVMEVAISESGVRGCFPCSDKLEFAVCSSKIKMDLIKGKCEVLKFSTIRKPDVLHWSTEWTYKILYKKEAFKLKVYYKYRSICLAEFLSSLYLIVLAGGKVKETCFRIKRVLFRVLGSL